MLKKFVRNEDGNYAVIFSLMMLPIMGAVGMSVDFSNISRLKYDLSDSLDAAGIATGKEFLASEKTDDELREFAKTYFKANFDENYAASTVVTVVLPTDAGNASQELIVKARLTYKTLFGPVLSALSGNDINKYVYVSEQTTLRMRNVAEIALVLDNSGSMLETVSTGDTRLALLKKASKDLITTLIKAGENIQQVNDPVKFSIVPFAGAVNIGNSAANKTASWMDTRGISPIHHENLNWGAPSATNVNGWRTTAADGAKLDASLNPLTRFSILDSLKFRKGGVESVSTSNCMVWNYGVNQPASSGTGNCAVFKRITSGANTVQDVGVATPEAVTAINNANYTLDRLKAKYQWGGCVESRPYPYNVTDETATSGNPSTLFVPWFAPDTLNFSQYGLSTNQNSAANYNNWWPDYETYTAASPYSSAAYQTSDNNQQNFNEASPGTATWVSGTSRPREVDVSKYLLNKPYLFGFSATNATATATRKGQWQYYLDSTRVTSQYFGPNFGCTTQAITPLTNDEDLLHDKIDAMVAQGSTNVTEGLAWGWRTISSKAPFTEGVPDSRKDIDKVIIVITDGKNTYYTPTSLGITDYDGNGAIYGSYGYTGYAGQTGPGAVSGLRGTGTVSSATNKSRLTQGTSVSSTALDNNTYSTAMISHMNTLCENVKNDSANIILMTIALDLNPAAAPTGDGAMITALSQCAGVSRTRVDSGGAPAKLFWNATSATLEQTFKEVADELSNLRFTG